MTMNWVSTFRPGTQSKDQKCAGRKVKIFTLVTGNTLDYHKTFVDRVTAKDWVTEVQRLVECDVILAFCVNSSRLKTDIDAALQMIPAEKPAILVVMHHTFNTKYILPETRTLVTRKEVLAVDCLFHEKEGILKSRTNDEAEKKALGYLKQHFKIEHQQPLDGIPDNDHLDSADEVLSPNEETNLTKLTEPVHSENVPSTSATAAAMTEEVVSTCQRNTKKMTMDEKLAREFHEQKMKYLKEEHEMKIRILQVELDMKLEEKALNSEVQ